MEKETKHRLKRSRRRERAERMQAQIDHGDSAEDDTLSGVKPHRPPARRKKTKEPAFEEDIIDGFAILAFRSYEDLEMAVKLAATKNTKYNLLDEKLNSQGSIRVINRHSPAQGHDAGTSDDSGRASEVRPPGLVRGLRESSHDHLSDASSRCSSGRGYICDSEGEDDKGSDGGSIFDATPTSTTRKSDTSKSGGINKPLLTNGVGSTPVVSHPPNGINENTKSPLAASLLNYSSSQIDKSFSSETEKNSICRFDSFGLNACEKPRPEINCSPFDKGLENNTHRDNNRPEINTHQSILGSVDKRLDGHLHQFEKGKLDSMQTEKNNVTFEKNFSLDKSHRDGASVEKTRIDGMTVQKLDNIPFSAHVEKRTLDMIPAYEKYSKDLKNDKCMPNNSVHGSITLEKRKDSHQPVSQEKGRIEREPALDHALSTISSLSSTGSLSSHVTASTLSGGSLHQQSILSGSNPASLKSLSANHLYHNSGRIHLHNAGLTSHNGTSCQFSPKKSSILHGSPIVTSSARPSTSLTQSVPSTTTSVSSTISNPNSIIVSMSSAGNPNNLHTTLSLSSGSTESGTVPSILQHAALHSVCHASNQRHSVDPIESALPLRSGANPPSGNVFNPTRPLNDSISASQVNNSPQLQIHVPSHSASHVGSQVVHGRLTPTDISPSSSISLTIAPSISSVTSSANSDALSVNSHSTIPFHGVAHHGVSTTNQAVVRSSRSPGIHSGYTLSLPGGPFSNYSSLYGPYSSNIQHHPYYPPRVELPVSSLGGSVSKQASGTVTTSTVTTSTVTSCTNTGLRDIFTTSAVSRNQSPRGHSPTRERDSYSSNVSSLSRGSATPINGAPSASPFGAASSSSLPNASSFGKSPAWGANPPGPVPTRSSLHSASFPTPMFAPPLPPAAAPPAPAPFSAESLFQTNQADLLRRELDNRFLASQERGIGVAPAFLRTEMHHHQHQHTHVHQHQAPTLYPPPLFKDMPKLGNVDSPFYRGNLGLVSYPGFSPGLLGPGIPSTPFAPPSHIPTFTPKQVGDASKPRILKSGKWNAMHVRVAWEIYHHQQKQSVDNKSGIGGSASKETLLRPSGHLFPSSAPRHDIGGYPPSFLPPHIGSTVTPFGRYPPMGSFGAPPSGLTGLTAFPSREMSSLAPLPSVHDPWRLRGSNAFPVGPSAWTLKPEAAVMDRREMEERERDRDREREREKERIRREREERERDRERRERDEKKKLELERERREKDRRELEKKEMERCGKVRERSPLRNGDVKEEPRLGKEEDVVMLGRTGPSGTFPPHSYGIGRHTGLRPPPPLTPHFAPSSWPPPPPGADPYAFTRLDPLLRYNALAPFRQEEESQRAKLFGVSGYLPPHVSHHSSSSPVLMKKEESQSR